MQRNQFETVKLESLSHQLLKVGRLVDQLGLSGAREAFGLEELSQTHLDLYPHIDFEGTTVTEIALRKGVSKQAVSKLVCEMVEMGLLEVKTCPEDARCKKVFFKTKGPFSIYKGMKVLKGIDGDLLNILGEKEYLSTLRKVNRVLDFVLEETKEIENE